MNIEGTPHEKALLVVSAYIIGFVSAYIAFTYAFPATGAQPVITYVPTLPDQTASVIDSQKVPPSPPAVTTEATSESPFSLVYENQGLYLYGVGDEPLLLSKDASAVNVTNTDAATLDEQQGLHSALPAYEYYAAHGLVYFCESYQNPNECVPYLYDIENNVLRVVQDESGPITVSVASAEAATVETVGLLQIGEYLSTSITAPWRVSTR